MRAVISVCREAVVGAEIRALSLVVRLRWVVFSVGMVDFSVVMVSSIEASCSGESVSAASWERGEHLCNLVGYEVEGGSTNLQCPKHPLTTTILLGRLPHDLPILLHLLEQLIRYRLRNLSPTINSNSLKDDRKRRGRE